MVITMSTIGFGNYVVQDGLSRIFIFLVSIAAIITFPMYVVAITNYLETNQQEKIGILLLKSLSLRESMEEEAAKIIQMGFKIYWARRAFNEMDQIDEKKNEQWNKLFKSWKKMQLYLIKFKIIKKQYYNNKQGNHF